MTREPSAASTVGCVAFVAACLIPVGLVYFAPYPGSPNIPWLLGPVVALPLFLWALIILNRRRFLLVAANIAVIGVLAWLLGTAWKATELDPTEVPISQATAPAATPEPQAVVTTSTVVATAAAVAASASASRVAATPRAERMAASVDERTKPLIFLGTALFNTG